MMWFIFALLSAVFAALTSILAKVGIDGVNSNLATAIRTMVRAPLQGLCYTVRDAVDWFSAPTTQMVQERFQPQPFAVLLIS